MGGKNGCASLPTPGSGCVDITASASHTPVHSFEVCACKQLRHGSSNAASSGAPVAPQGARSARDGCQQGAQHSGQLQLDRLRLCKPLHLKCAGEESPCRQNSSVAHPILRAG